MAADILFLSVAFRLPNEQAVIHLMGRLSPVRVLGPSSVID